MAVSKTADMGSIPITPVTEMWSSGKDDGLQNHKREFDSLHLC